MFQKLPLSAKILMQSLLIFLGILYLIPLANAVTNSMAGAGFGN